MYYYIVSNENENSPKRELLDKIIERIDYSIFIWRWEGKTGKWWNS